MNTLGFLNFAELGRRPLAAALRQGDDEHVIRLLESATGEVALDSADVMTVLKETVSDQARNAAALALVDLREPRALDALVEVLNRPEIAQAAGTLVYALNELGGTLPLSTLVMLLARGSFEARAESLTLLECGRVRIPTSADREAARRNILQLSRSQDADLAAHSALALELLAHVEANPH